LFRVRLPPQRLAGRLCRQRVQPHRTTRVGRAHGGRPRSAPTTPTLPEHPTTGPWSLGPTAHRTKDNSVRSAIARLARTWPIAIRLARYYARNPVALVRLTYDRAAKVVTYPTSPRAPPPAPRPPTRWSPTGPGPHPDKGQVTTRYYGSYTTFRSRVQVTRSRTQSAHIVERKAARLSGPSDVNSCNCL